jgi:hypothetical protein
MGRKSLGRRTGDSKGDRLCVRGASHEFENWLADGYYGSVVTLDVLDHVRFSRVEFNVNEMILTMPSSNLSKSHGLGQLISMSEEEGETHSTTSFTFGRAYAPSASITSQSSPATTVPSSFSSYPSAVVRVPDFGSYFSCQQQ